MKVVAEWVYNYDVMGCFGEKRRCEFTGVLRMAWRDARTRRAGSYLHQPTRRENEQVSQWDNK